MCWNENIFGWKIINSIFLCVFICTLHNAHICLIYMEMHNNLIYSTHNYFMVATKNQDVRHDAGSFVSVVKFNFLFYGWEFVSYWFS